MAVTERTTMNSESNADKERRELDTLVENISRILEQEDEEIYSREVIAEFRNPTHAGRMRDADACGIADGLCMDSMEIYLKVESGRIKACSFFTDGCGAAISCGNRLARYVEGMSLDTARMVNPSDLITLLNGLPPDHKHCAALAVIALRNALRDVERHHGPKKERDP
ncbi:MAG: iron-sulfur cluster assembly scaffold protein [Thermoplasmata archaeon]